ncbi:hypothetical protein FF38_07699 [Lucilia cuprina]|uniref:Uncharacterized protein n=1 Tax=Lucilia cuprina TaxID=7375 RepID=A0A0L0BQW8_LUCCU|nr:hypothetical protein FF38_07699 [Lucilia cuprina]
MAKKTTEKSLKRKRINGTHRWTDAETLHLVQEVAEEVKVKIESYEKPTAQYFYKKIAAKSTILKSIEWVPMKNLKSSYMSALNWRNQTGAGLLATGDEKTVEEYIDKICPMFKYLEQIFGQRRGVNLLIIIETSMEDRDIDCVVGEVEILSSFIDEEEFFEASENNTSSSPEASFSSQTLIDSISLKESMKKIPKKTPKSKNTSPLRIKKYEIEVKYKSNTNSN